MENEQNVTVVIEYIGSKKCDEWYRCNRATVMETGGFLKLYTGGDDSILINMALVAKLTYTVDKD